MTFKLAFRPIARHELEAAALWYEGQQRGLGADFLSEVDRVLDLVLAHPERFPEVHRGLRRVRVKRFPYSVIYRITGAVVVVHAVFHARRDPTVWKKNS